MPMMAGFLLHGSFLRFTGEEALLSYFLASAMACSRPEAADAVDFHHDVGDSAERWLASALLPAAADFDWRPGRRYY